MKESIIRKRCGFTLLEMILVVVVMTIILSAVSPNIVKEILNRYGTKTALDISTIQDAARTYFIDKGSWPSTIGNLTEGGQYLPATWDGISPFNQPYSLSSNAALFTVSTDVQEGAQKAVVGLLPATTINGTTVASSVGALGGEDGVPVGAVMPWPGLIAPDRWFLCDGSAVSRAAYSELFAVLGTTFGPGNGTSTFNIPDLRGRTIIGVDASQTEFDQVGKSGGNKTVSFSHSHVLARGPYSAQNLRDSSGNTWGWLAVTTNFDNWDPAVGTGLTGDISTKESTATANVLNPFTTANWIIKAE